MLAISLVIGLVLLAFVLNKCNSTEMLITLIVLLMIFFCALHYFYNNTESDPQQLYTENVRKLKKKQQLNDTFDALLNKNNSSAE
ncbi:ORF_92 [Adoxophyes orana granulovirus]|uniref:ADOR92 n=1 Tax=Adoxophyes orana granulovirus TaxID=170617 RepID=Q7T9S3_GVAO|nr:ORF_92 [Adoxophyes orana granulovirus]AAP85729.1 ORF_92 [Adoxophyes orana granulovirus]AJA91732.1 ADOR92 [Adoxophyes orana granulovirus]